MHHSGLLSQPFLVVSSSCQVVFILYFQLFSYFRCLVLWPLVYFPLWFKMSAIVLFLREERLKGVQVGCRYIWLDLKFRDRVPTFGLVLLVGLGLELWNYCEGIPLVWGGWFLSIGMEGLQGDPFRDSEGNYLQRLSTVVVSLASTASSMLARLGNKGTPSTSSLCWVVVCPVIIVNHFLLKEASSSGVRHSCNPRKLTSELLVKDPKRFHLF